MSPIVVTNSSPSGRVKRVRSAGNSSWRLANFPTPYTPPVGIDAYGRGTVLDTTWDLAGQTGTVHACTTEAHVTTALTAANPGDVIRIDGNIVAPAGGWYLGNRGAGTIYIVSDYVAAGTFERRASVSDWSTLSLAQIPTEITACRARKSDTYRILDVNNGSPTDPVFFVTAAASTRWVLAGLELRTNPSSGLTGTPNYGLLRLQRDTATGYEATSLDDICGNIWVDRCYIHAGPTQNIRRGIFANGKNFALTNSCIAEIHERGNADTQCVSKTTGGGPFKYVNNTLEGAGQTVMTGAGPSVEALQLTDGELRFNHHITPLGMLLADAENAASAWSGLNYTQKTIFESKFARRVWMEGCLLSRNRGSFGFAIQLQSLPDDGTNSYLGTEDWSIRQCRIDKSYAGINFSGNPYAYAADPSTRMHALDLLMTDLGSAADVTRRVIQFSGVGDVDVRGVTAIASAYVVTAVLLIGDAAGDLTLKGLATSFQGNGVNKDGGGGNGDTGLTAYMAAHGTPATWENNVLYDFPGEPYYATNYDGSANTTLLNAIGDVGFENVGAGLYDISGTYATDKCNATLVRTLTDSLNVEGYT